MRIASAPISSARSAAAVSVVKKGFPVPSRKDDHAPLLEMTDGPAPDVRLRDLADGDGREHARVDAALLERPCAARQLRTVASMPA